MSIYRRIIAFVLLLCLGLAVRAAAGREVVVMVTFENLSMDDIAGPYHADFQPLLTRGALGLMNNKTDSYYAFENTAATISAGTHAVGAAFPSDNPYTAMKPAIGPAVKDTGFEYARAAYMPDETVDGVPAIELFARNTGTVPPPGSIVLTSLAALRADNTPQRYKIIPGILGQQLGDAGVQVSVYGNSDRGAIRSRCGVVIGMNRAGWAPGGDVSNRTLFRDPMAPYGVRTNFDYIADAINNLPDGRHFVVVEAGDGSRADVAAAEMLPKRAAEAKSFAVRRCARFLTALDAALRVNTDRYRIIFVGAAPGKEAIKRCDLLTPVLFLGNDIDGGLITSATTKRPGLIANIDLTAAVLRYYDIHPDPSILGLPVTTLPHAGALDYLRALNTRMVISFQGRFPILIGFVVLVALAVLWTLTVLIGYNRFSGVFRGLQRPGAIRLTLVALMLVPFMMMVGGGLGIYRVMGTVLFTAAASLAAAALLLKITRDARVLFAVIGFALVGLLCADLLVGGPLLQRTMLSHDPIAGIRFYGLGNESCGVLLGALLLGLYALLDLRGRMGGLQITLVLLLYIVVFVIIGGPQYGAKFGGMLAVIPGFGFALVKACTGRARRAVLLWGGICALALLVVMIAVNAAGQSHIGLAFRGASRVGPQVLIDLALRKWAMNFRLVKSSVWTVAFVSLVLGSGVLLFRPVGIVRQVLRTHPLLNAGFIGIVIGLIVAMLTNDSGVAMAATGLLYLVAPLMLLVLAEMERREGTGEAVSNKQ